MAGPKVNFSAPPPIVNGIGEASDHIQVTSDRIIVGVDFGTTYSG
jgi:hypothetical protein